jgi:ATP:corrinoid adenosyltransferase
MNGRQLVNPAELVTEVVDVRHSYAYHSNILARDGIEV